MNRFNIYMKRMGLKDIDTFLLILVEFHWLLTASLGFGGRFLPWPFGIPVRFLAFAFMLGRRILFLSCGDLGWCGSGCFLCSLSWSVKISPSFFANISISFTSVLRFQTINCPKISHPQYVNGGVGCVLFSGRGGHLLSSGFCSSWMKNRSGLQ